MHDRTYNPPFVTEVQYIMIGITKVVDI